MPDFNPDEYLAKKSPSSGGFDPDAYLSKKPEPTKKPSRFTEAESGALGFTQGATFGFGDEIAGGLLATVAKLQGNPKPFKQLYESERDSQRGLLKEAQANNPKSFIGGEVGGSVATSFIPGLGIAKGATTAAKIGKTAALGGLAAAGLSEADPTKSPDELGSFAKDVAGGAALGGALQGAGIALGKAASTATPQSLKEYANKRALSAAGFMTKDTKRLSPDQQQKIGRALLDNKVVTALSSLDDVAERAGAAKQQAGRSIGEALGKVDDLVATAKKGIDEGTVLPGVSAAEKEAAKKYLDQNFQFSRQKIADRIEQEIIKPNANNPLVSAEMEKLGKLSESFRAGSDALTLKGANQIKATQGKLTKFGSDSVPNAFKEEVYSILKTELEDIVGKTGNLESGIQRFAGSGKQIGPGAQNIASDNAKALAEYQAAKSNYGALKTAEQTAQARAGNMNANRTISLTDYIAGAAGLGTGGPAAAVALGSLNKIARKYGASVQAVSADKLANGIEAVIAKSPEALKKFSPLLSEAAKKGNKALIGVHLALMKEPDYASLMNQQEDEPQASSNPFERRLNTMRGTP